MDNMKGLGGALPNRKGGKGKPAPAEEEDDDEEFDPSTLSASEKAKLVAALKGGMTGNPELIKALQGRLDGLVGRNSGYIDSLPSKVSAFACAGQRCLGGRRLLLFWRQSGCEAQACAGVRACAGAACVGGGRARSRRRGGCAASAAAAGRAAGGGADPKRETSAPPLSARAAQVKRRVEHLEKLQEEHDALYETYKARPPPPERPSKASPRQPTHADPPPCARAAPPRAPRRRSSARWRPSTRRCTRRCTTSAPAW